MDSEGLVAITSRLTLPLTEIIRPTTLDEYIGQEHLVQEGGAISNFLRLGYLPSMILYGPPGVGKTTLASILAQESKYVFVELSATDSTISDLRSLLEAIRLENSKRHRFGTPWLRVVVFVDEIHRFTSTQQDFLLPFVEAGDFVFIGATTVEPKKRIRRAILSRCQLFHLKALENEHVVKVLRKAALYENIRRKVGRQLMFLLYGEKTYQTVAKFANGDTRSAINFIELFSSRFIGETYKIGGSGVTDIDDVTVEATIKSLTKARFGLQNDENIPLFVQLFNSMNRRGTAPKVKMVHVPQLVTFTHDQHRLLVTIRLLAASSDLESIIDEKEIRDSVPDSSAWAEQMEVSDDSDVEAGPIYSDDDSKSELMALERLSASKFHVLSAVHTLLLLLRGGESPLFLLKHLILYVCMYTHSDTRELPKVMGVLKALEKSTVDATHLLSNCVERLTSLQREEGFLLRDVRWMKQYFLERSRDSIEEVVLDKCEVVFDEELVEKLLREPEIEQFQVSNERIPVSGLTDFEDDEYTLGWQSMLNLNGSTNEELVASLSQ